MATSTWLGLDVRAGTGMIQNITVNAVSFDIPRGRDHEGVEFECTALDMDQNQRRATHARVGFGNETAIIM